MERCKESLLKQEREGRRNGGGLSKDSREGKIQRRLCTCRRGISGCSKDPRGGLSNAEHQRCELSPVWGRGQDWRQTRQSPHRGNVCGVSWEPGSPDTEQTLGEIGHKKLAEEA